MEKIKSLNLKEIEYLARKFSIKYENGSFEIGKSFSVQDIYDAILFLKKEIWNNINVRATISRLKDQKEEEILYYWLPESNEPIDTFLEKAGILNYRVVISDPLSWICSINPNLDISPEKNPEAYLKILLESALFLNSLRKWIETDQLLLLPDIHLWDYFAWKDLGEINNKLFSQYDVENTEIGKKVFALGAFEAGVEYASEAIRLMQQNATIETIKKTPVGMNDDEAQKVLEYLKKLPKNRRDEEAVFFIANQYGFSEDEAKERIKRLRKQDLFRIENYVDISKLKGSLSIRHSMPLTLALYMGDQLNAIPTTDYLLNKLTMDLYAQFISLTDEYKEKQELIDSKIQLDLPFFSGLTPEFVAKQKTSGTAMRLRDFLNDEWRKIRGINNPDNYVIAVRRFSQSVHTEFENLRGGFSQIKKQALAETGEVLTSTTGAFIEGMMQNDIWMAVAKSIPTLFGGSIAVYKSYNLKKYELKKNPLFIFLEKKR